MSKLLARGIDNVQITGYILFFLIFIYPLPWEID